jgi:hypothetical protein
MAHDAEYFRQRRRARGIQEKEPFAALRFVEMGSELRRLELLAQLPETPAEGSESVCPCGCRRDHLGNVTQTIRSTAGRGFHVVYFTSEACRQRWNRERTREG